MEHLSFMDAKRYAKAATDGMKHRSLAVVGDFATQHFCVALKGVAAYWGIGLNIWEADYNQIDLQLLNRASETYQYSPDEILIFMCTEVLYAAFCKTPIEKRAAFAEMQYEQIWSYWKTVEENSHAGILQTTFLEYDDRVFGNWGSKLEQSFIFQVRKLNYLLTSGAATNGNVSIVDMSCVCSMFSMEQLIDPKMYYWAKLPYALSALPVIAKQVVDIVKAHMGQLKKCIVLDLDNTLWGGTVGDDGSDGIQIGGFGSGPAYTAFQVWLKELKNRGILLAVCSKNEESVAKEPFLKNPEMVLHLEDFSLFKAGWGNKAQAILEIQKKLNIGMDSIVFVDDDPFERESVRQFIPEVVVPEMPRDPCLYVDYLKNLNLFETVSISDEDTKRTAQYQNEMEREREQDRFATFDEYLAALEMKAEVKPFDIYYIPRIAQLCQRSNQFNLRTVRYSEADIERIASSSEYIARYFTLADRFGDYGLIGVAILQKQNAGTLFIDTWLMSCRVLKRGMEEFIINSLVKEAQNAGFQKLVGEYIPSSKNMMASGIYQLMGFKKTSEKFKFVLDVANFIPKPTHIKEVPS